MEIFNRKRLIILLLLVIITPLGFLTKFYSGPAEIWIQNSFGGLLYEIFWCLVFGFIFIGTKPLKIAIWVFLITSMLEVLQLWSIPLIDNLRNTFLGQTILGSSFNWYDFPYYIAGSIIGYLLLEGINRITDRDKLNLNT
jgi:hypothetical protein